MRVALSSGPRGGENHPQECCHVTDLKGSCLSRLGAHKMRFRQCLLVPRSTLQFNTPLICLPQACSPSTSLPKGQGVPESLLIPSSFTLVLLALRLRNSPNLPIFLYPAVALGTGPVSSSQDAASASYMCLLLPLPFSCFNICFHSFFLCSCWRQTESFSFPRIFISPAPQIPFSSSFRILF